MNKKFFAALASATMAFTASGSIAVFADDFIEEKTPVVDNGDVTPLPETVVWNEDNFGILVELAKDKFTGFTGTTLEKDKSVKTAELAEVTAIDFAGSNLKGEVKGLEYFTKLESFDDSAIELTNSKLDFSANKVLKTLSVTKAADLAEIVLPEPTVDEKTEVKTYSLKSLTLKKTALTSLDLSAQAELKDVIATGNANLKDVKVDNGTKRDVRVYTTLNLSGNNLANIDLAHTEFTTLKLNKNHIGALDLSDTKVNKTLELKDQTFYVSETLKNVNLAETFENFEKEAIEAQEGVYDQKTGILTTNGKDTTYEYNTLVNGSDVKLQVKLEAANPMNRLYNPNSGEHFYTADIKEKEALVALGWNDEGYGWVAPKKEDGTAVYRLYNPNAGDHHYTKDENEAKTLATFGWKEEGIGWYSKGNVPVYRQYNPYANGAGSHNYTTDKAENDYLLDLGWTPEGTAWKALQ